MSYFCKYGTSSSVISDIPGGFPPTLSALAAGNHSPSLRAVHRNNILKKCLGEEGGQQKRSGQWWDGGIGMDRMHREEGSFF